MVFPESPASSADDEVDLLGLGSTVTSEEFLQYRFSWLLSSAINVWLFLVIKYKVTYTKIRKYEIVCIKSMIIKLHLYRNKNDLTLSTHKNTPKFVYIFILHYKYMLTCLWHGVTLNSS